MAGLSGCALESQGLPAGIPQLGGGVFFIVTTSMPDGVMGRSYTRTVQLKGGLSPFSCIFTASGGQTGPPPGMTVAAVLNTCVVSAPTGALTTTGFFTYNVQASDRSKPPQVATQTFSQVIRSEFAFTPTGLPDGVVGRPYGTAAGTTAPVVPTNISGTVGNSPLTQCILDPSSVTMGNTINIALTANGAGCQVTASGNLSAPGALTLNFRAMDSPIMDPDSAGVTVVPAGTVPPMAMPPTSVAMMSQMPLSYTRNFNPVPDGVVSRTYGASPQTPLTFNVAGGLSSRMLTSAVTTAPAGTNMACSAPGTTVTCSSGGMPVSGSSGAFTVTMTASDSGNSATPPGSTNIDTNGNTSHTSTFHPEIVVSISALGNGTELRAFDTNFTGTPLITTNGGGIQASLACMATGLPGGISTVTTAAPNCRITGTPNAGTAPGSPYTVTVNVTDGGNLAVPPPPAPLSGSSSLTINPALTLNPFALNPSTQNIPYNGGMPFNIGFAGGNGTVTCTQVGNNLPATMAVGTAAPNCTISGTPNSTVTNVTITVQAMDTPTNTTAAGTPTQSSKLTINPPVTITSASPLPTGVTGRNYNLTLTSTGGTAPITWTSTGAAPALNAGDPNCGGLMFSTGGVISGSSSAPATTMPVTCSFMVTATDSVGSTDPNKAFAITFNPALSLSSFNFTTTGTVGVAYPTVNIPFTGGLGTFSCKEVGSNLPTGMMVGISGSNCTISGTPSAGVNAAITVQVMDTGNPATATPGGNSPQTSTNNLVVVAVTITTASPLPPAEVGETYSFTLTETGGTAPFSWTNPGGSASSLNTGNTACTNLVLSGAGVITNRSNTNRPTTNGMCTFQATVKDKNGFTDTKTLTLPVNSTLAIMTASPLPFGVTMRNYNLTFLSVAGSGNGGALTWTNPNGNLGTVASCAGLSLNAMTGVLSAAPLTGGAGSCAFDVQVSEANTATTSGATTPAMNFNFMVQPALMVTTTQAQILNGLLNNPYTGLTFTATGGIGAQTWVAPGVNTPPCPVPTGSIDGLALSAAGALSGTPAAASTAPNFFAFQVCVFDVGNTAVPAGFALGNFTFDVMNNLAYAAGAGVLNSVEVINTSTNAPVASILLGAGASPNGVAITPNGRFAIVTQNGLNKISVIDTILNAEIAGSPVAIPGTTNCGKPTGVGVSPDGVNVYVACDDTTAPNVEEVIVLSAAALTSAPATAFPPAATIVTGVGSLPDSIAFRDATRGYVTLSGSNQMIIINNTGTPAQVGVAFALTVGRATPLELTVVPNGAKFYAYIAKENVAGVGAVDVVDVTTDALSIVTSVDVGFNVKPFGVAGVPGTNARIYVALNGSNQYTVFDNTVTSPVIAAAAPALPYFVPDPTAVSGLGVPVGVAIPPLGTVPASGLPVFITLSATDGVAVVNDAAALTTANAKNAASPIAVTPTAAPGLIRSIPIPK